MNTEEIINKLGFESTNAMQDEVADCILHSDKDVVVLSPTGSGKTLAFLLPLAQRINTTDDNIQAIVIVPGRELAMQSAAVAEKMGCGLRAMSVYGGNITMEEHREIKRKKPHILFATPGRLNDHLDKENINAQYVSWLIIDEFDKCLDMGFEKEMEKAVETLSYVKRRILLSATKSDSIPGYVRMGRTIIVDYSSDDDNTPERVGIFTVKSKDKDKLVTLRRLLLDCGQQSSIVFLNYRDAVERTGLYLKEQGFSVSIFHGGLDQKQREEALYLFANGSSNILVSTDLSSRGIDIPGIQNIIHYHLPETRESYIHRIGRTARWDAEGTTFFIISPEENIPEYVEHSEEYLISENTSKPPLPLMTTIYIGKGKKDKISRGDILGFLCRKGGMTSEEIGKIDVYERYSYVAVRRDKANIMLKRIKGEKIKGLRTIYNFFAPRTEDSNT